MNRLMLLFPALAVSMAVAASTASQSFESTPLKSGPKRIVPVMQRVDDDVVLHVPGTDQYMRVGDLRKSRPAKVAKAPADNQTSSLREDFDKMTGGSATEPDRQTSILDALGNVLSEYTNIPGWVGSEIWMADGSCFLDYNFSTYSPGYIQTPNVNLSMDNGNFTVKLNARNYDPSEPAWIMVYHSPTGNFNGMEDMQDAELSDEFEEYSFDFTGGTTTSVVRIELYSGVGAFVDYVDILQNSDGLLSPHVNPATGVSSTGFTASWTAVPGAASYKLDLWHKVIDPDHSVVDRRVEDFSGLVTEDEKFCQVVPNRNDEMFCIAGVSEGWEIGVAKAGEYRHYYSSPDYYQSAPYSMCFDADFDYFFTPQNNEKSVSRFEFWIKSEVLDESDKLYILFNLNTTGETTTADDIYMYTLAEYYNEGIMDEGIIFEVPMDYIPENVNSVHVQWGGNYYEPSQGYAAVDDIVVEYGVDEPTLPVNDVEGLVVEGTSYTFTDLQEDETYYYTVTAVGSDGSESMPSNEQSVVLTFMSLDAPEAYDFDDPLVEIADDGTVYESFYANWSDVDNADGYELSLDLVHRAPADEVYTLDAEDFSGIPSRAEPSNPDTYNYSSLDVSTYCNRVGWRASLPVLAAGMLGGQYGVYSPQYDLSHGGGAYTVDITLYGQVGDVVTVTAYDYSGSGNNETQECTLTSESQDFTLEFANGSENIGLSFTTTGYYVLLDNFSLAQALEAGDETRMTYFVGRQNGMFNRGLVYVVDRHAGDTYIYKVRAYGVNALGNEILSQYSNEVPVDLGELPSQGVGTGTEAGAARVYVTGDDLVVELMDDADVVVYSINGVQMMSDTACAGVNTYHLGTDGVYIVKVGSEVYKVVK